jgi:hypothetical protein
MGMTRHVMAATADSELVASSSAPADAGYCRHAITAKEMSIRTDKFNRNRRANIYSFP